MLIILLILIFIRPFISSLAFPYVNFIYSILLLGFLIVWIITKGLHLKEINSIRYPLIFFILAIFISLIFSQDKITSIKELYKYISGILLFLVSISLANEDKDGIIFCIIVSGFVISLLALYQYFFGFQRLLGYISKQGISDSFVLDYVSRKRVYFPFVTPNVLGGYLAMIIPLTLTYKNRIWFAIPLSFALLLTKSLGGLLSLFLGLVIYFYLPRPCVQERGLQGKLEKRRLLFFFGLLMIIVFVLIIRSVTGKQHIQPIFSGMMRLGYWKDALRIIRVVPFTGVGLGNFSLPQSRYAHNSYLQIWAEMGILGIISILWFIATVFKFAFINIRKSIRKSQIASLIAANTVFLTHNFVDFTFFLPEVSMLWWIILGLIISKDNNELNYHNTNL